MSDNDPVDGAAEGRILPTVMLDKTDGEPAPAGPSLGDRLTDLSARVSDVLDALGRPMTPYALAWHNADERRRAARSEENLTALREANKAHREASRELRRDRKLFEQARSEVAWWNIFNGERRAARAVVRDTNQMVREARQVQREAQAAYPRSLTAVAARWHALHAVPSFVWALATDSFLIDCMAATSVAAVAANVAVVRLGGRHVATAVAAERDAAVADAQAALYGGFEPSQEERDLLQRLDPAAWSAVAAPRGLSDVLVSGATLTASGIQVKLSLCNTLDLKTLQSKEAQLRAALRIREGTRVELRDGSSGGHARLTIRTRSQADGLDLSGWKPGDAWAVNTVTGETVPVPLGKRILVAGTSGSGKSWSARPLMAEASEWADHRLIIFDRKHVEGRNWEHRARIVTELDEMDAVCDELIEEGEERLKAIPRGRDTVEISTSRPRITVFVDEGGELISDCKKDYATIIDRLRTVARKYRAAEIILVWATQKPSLTGDGHGIDSQIAGQMNNRLSLAVATAADSRVVFGEDASERGWTAHNLPMPGFAFFREQDLGAKSVPQMLRMRAMSAMQVIALPPRPIWSRQVSSTGATAQDIRERMAMDPWAGKDVGGEQTVSMRKPRVSAEDRDDQILSELSQDPCRSISSLATATGASKSVVKKRLGQMEADGLVWMDSDGCWHVVTD